MQLNDGQVARLVERYGAGATVYDLAEEFGVHRATISRSLRRAGVTLRLQPPDAGTVEEMVKLYIAGQSLAAVARALGTNTRTVQRYLQHHGVPIRDTHGRSRIARTRTSAAER